MPTICSQGVARLSACPTLPMSLSLALSPNLSISLSVSQSFSPSLSFTLSLSLSLSLSRSVSLFCQAAGRYHGRHELVRAQRAREVALCDVKSCVARCQNATALSRCMCGHLSRLGHVYSISWTQLNVPNTDACKTSHLRNAQNNRKPCPSPSSEFLVFMTCTKDAKSILS